MSAYINIKKKKKHNPITKKKKRKTLGGIIKRVEQRGEKKDSRNQSTVATTVLHSRCTVPKYCGGITAFIINHLFSIVVGHIFIFYYFILTYKKLISQ